MGQMKDLTGREFGYLTAIEPTGKRINRSIVWKCVCVCGNYKYASSHDLQQGHVKSCGCMTRDMQSDSHIKHGYRKNRARPRIYRIWTHMKDRCNNPRNKSFFLYGGRGITVCDSWNKDFCSFYKWAMENGYEDTLEIDRIDTNGNYEPDNCRFVTDLVQARNSRHCIYQDIDGERLCLTEIAEKAHITKATIYWRYRNQGKRNGELLKGDVSAEKTVL